MRSGSTRLTNKVGKFSDHCGYPYLPLKRGSFGAILGIESGKMLLKLGVAKLVDRACLAQQVTMVRVV